MSYTYVEGLAQNYSHVNPSNVFSGVSPMGDWKAGGLEKWQAQVSTTSYYTPTVTMEAGRFIKLVGVDGESDPYHYIWTNPIRSPMSNNGVSTIRLDFDGYIPGGYIGLVSGMSRNSGVVYFSSCVLFSTINSKLFLVLHNGSGVGISMNTAGSFSEISIAGMFLNAEVVDISETLDTYNKTLKNLYTIVLKLAAGAVQSVEPVLYINGDLIKVLPEYADADIKFSTDTFIIMGCYPSLSSGYWLGLKSLSLQRG